MSDQAKQPRSCIAVIGARGGSKGLPGKNIRDLNGKPLIAWSIEQALNSSRVDTVLVDTDDEAIAAVARDYGAEVPFLRPPEFATDEASIVDAVAHTLTQYRELSGHAYDIIALLEPTSPLREPGDIDAMVATLSQSWDRFDGLVSLGRLEREHPSIMKTIRDDGQIETLMPPEQTTQRRQDNAPVYFPYGVGYLVKWDTFFAERAFYPQRCTYHLIKRYQHYEIDDIYDFLAIENIMKHEWNLA